MDGEQQSQHKLPHNRFASRLLHIIDRPRCNLIMLVVSRSSRFLAEILKNRGADPGGETDGVCHLCHLRRQLESSIQDSLNGNILVQPFPAKGSAI
jgi:hypothetical protein